MVPCAQLTSTAAVGPPGAAAVDSPTGAVGPPAPADPPGAAAVDLPCCAASAAAIVPSLRCPVAHSLPKRNANDEPAPVSVDFFDFCGETLFLGARARSGLAGSCNAAPAAAAVEEGL